MADMTPQITDLTATIQKATDTINRHFISNNLPSLTFAPTSTTKFPACPDHVMEARVSLLEACSTLSQLISGPTEYVRSSLWNHLPGVVQYIVHFGIQDIVPLDGSTIHYADIAAKAGVDESVCKRVIRMAMTHRLFWEPEPGFVSHTAPSLYLAFNSKAMLYVLEESMVASGWLSAAVEKYPGSQERNHTPWNIAYGVEQPFFDFAETQPKRMNSFMAAMMTQAKVPEYDPKWVVQGFDWASIGSGTVVDVAGNAGHISQAISVANPSLNFIVQDLEKVVGAADTRVQGQNMEKLKFQVYDMFKQTQPVKGAEVYLLRFILHDYSDKYAAIILKNIVPAMGPNSRIIIAEMVMPEPGTVPRIIEKKMR